MSPRTIATIAELEQVKWFQNVGAPRATDDSIVRARSWEGAIRYCCSEDWEGITLNAFNDRRSFLYDVHPDWSGRKWNALILEFKSLIVPIVDRAVQPVAERHRLPPRFGHCVQWDILGFCEEIEFAEVFKPALFTRLGDLYIAGHFPCGWEGPFPQGKLVVF